MSGMVAVFVGLCAVFVVIVTKARNERLVKKKDLLKAEEVHQRNLSVVEYDLGTKRTPVTVDDFSTP